MRHVFILCGGLLLVSCGPLTATIKADYATVRHSVDRLYPPPESLHGRAQVRSVPAYHGSEAGFGVERTVVDASETAAFVLIDNREKLYERKTVITIIEASKSRTHVTIDSRDWEGVPLFGGYGRDYSYQRKRMREIREDSEE